MSKTSKSHSNLLLLLQQKESAGKNVTVNEILKATGWKPSTLRTYKDKGQLSEFLSEIKEGLFSPHNTTTLSPELFTRKLSQSKHRRELGHKCKSGLAKALLKKSKDNMILALELYNRPSLENRLDGFVFCFCASWEQLLKSMLIEKNGEESIFKSKPNPAGIRETISLRESLGLVYSNDDSVRKNIERIIFYRDQAIHLLMPELQAAVSRVFQSGIMNFNNEFNRFAEQSFISSSHLGMLSLVGDIRNPSNTSIMNKYGASVGKEVISLLEKLNNESEEINDIEFAIPLNVKLFFAKNDSDGNVVALSKAEEGMEGLKNAIVVEKPVDRHSTHPYRRKDAISEINCRLHEKYNHKDLESVLVSIDNKTGKLIINTNDFDAVVYKLKWRKSTNKFHYLNKNPEMHYYSDDAIEEFIKKISSSKNWLKRAKGSFNNRLH